MRIWPCGGEAYAAVCKTAYAGAIPAMAFVTCRGGEIAIHEGLKIPWRKLRAGWSPAPGTI